MAEIVLSPLSDSMKLQSLSASLFIARGKYAQEIKDINYLRENRSPHDMI